MILRLAILLASLAALPVTAAADPVGDTAVADSHPQVRVAVDGARRLNLYCVGQGAPTVLLDAGSGGSTADWMRVQPRLGAITRSCAYDRAGYGFSDAAERPATADAAVDDLQRLISAAHLGPRLILVGHSNGGLYAALFAERHLDMLGGLLLIDPGFPGQQNYAAYGLEAARAAALSHWAGSLITLARGCLDAARSGALAAPGAHSDCLDTPPNDPAELRAALRRISAGVPYEAALTSEYENSFEADPNGQTADDRAFPNPLRPVGALPLIVLTAGHHPVPVSGFTNEQQRQFWMVWKTGHDRLAALSAQGMNHVISDSGHFIQNDRPDAVVSAVADIVAAVRRGAAAIGQEAP